MSRYWPPRHLPWRGMRPVALGALAGGLILANIGFPTATAMTTVPPTSRLLRLHVVGNSNSQADQAVKLEVRDAVLTLLAPHLEGAREESQATGWIRGHMGEIRRTVRHVLESDDRPYGAHLQLGEQAFPTKTLGSFVFPAGRYAALDIFLGKAQGQNWWCVLFPQLCFVSPTSSLTTAEPASPSPKLAREAAGQRGKVAGGSYRLSFYTPALFQKILRFLGI